MYNGLTTADKDALLDAIAHDGEWIVRTPDNLVWSNSVKPVRYEKSGDWNQLNGRMHIIGGADTLTFIKSNDSEPANSYTALAQIAEMELTTNSTPLTCSERINQMTVEEKARWLYDMDVCRVSSISIEECNSYRHCTDCMKNLLNSPYTEGETK